MSSIFLQKIPLISLETKDEIYIIYPYVVKHSNLIIIMFPNGQILQTAYINTVLRMYKFWMWGVIDS